MFSQDDMNLSVISHLHWSLSLTLWRFQVDGRLSTAATEDRASRDQRRCRHREGRGGGRARRRGGVVAEVRVAVADAEAVVVGEAGVVLARRQETWPLQGSLTWKISEDEISYIGFVNSTDDAKMR